jgi:hypothetical protein
MARARARKTGKVYIANESFVVNLDANGRVMTDGSGIDKSFHENRTRAYEGDPIVDHAPDWFDELEDVDTAQSYE